MANNASAWRAKVSKLVSVVAIIPCGVGGALAAFALVNALGLTGVTRALVAVIAAVFVATLLWAFGVAMLRSLRWIK